MKTVTITGDSSEIEKWLTELRRLGELFPDVVKSLLNGILTGTLKFSEFFSAHPDRGGAVPAGEIRFSFQPTPFLLGYMAALQDVQGTK